MILYGKCEDERWRLRRPGGAFIAGATFAVEAQAERRAHNFAAGGPVKRTVFGDELTDAQWEEECNDAPAALKEHNRELRERWLLEQRQRFEEEERAAAAERQRVEEEAAAATEPPTSEQVPPRTEADDEEEDDRTLVEVDGEQIVVDRDDAAPTTPTDVAEE